MAFDPLLLPIFPGRAADEEQPGLAPHARTGPAARGREVRHGG